jgi:hypothetical protein
VQIDSSDILSFSGAIKNALNTGNKLHLLLGNGFSRALRDDIFSYSALFDRADFRDLSPSARQAFDNLGTRDFEAVIRGLRNAALLLDAYTPDRSDLADAMRKDANGLKGVLASTIAQNHPECPNEISDSQFEACRAFLKHFKNIYTLNYDLLLYWAFMHQTNSPTVLKHDDGFRKPVAQDADYVCWEVENSDTQTMFYLHGALHLFDAGTELQKYTWINTGVRLIQQIREALDQDFYPLIVAEGTSEQKKERIGHSGYLNRARRSFSAITGELFIHGHSMSSADEHVLSQIEHPKSKITGLWIGLYGDPSSAGVKRILSRVQRMVHHRDAGSRPLRVSFYDATSAKVWG